ncbi:MAG: SMP-30/gluconolactonase/LRE family protein [Armatimonadota bacterium]
MQPLRLLPALAGAALAACLATGAAAQYEPGPDSKPQPGVPKGEVLKFSFEDSRIFPGTYRDYWVYVPAQYNPATPACLYVNQDGIQWQAPTVFDNLIHKKEMPVTIGVFVMHGRVRAANEQAALDRFNRSLEYDGLGDRYARFLVEELLPDVEKKKTSDGRAIRLSRRAADRAIGGSSSGAVCAFTAAWERPDQFSRVFSAIGTYVGIRGADRYPTLLRKYEPKPIRVFLQDGRNDLNIYAGDWWEANQMMERALKFAGYEVEHVWGEGGHNGQHGTAVFPDAMRWLWKGWPAAVGNGRTGNDTMNRILRPGAGWEKAAGDLEKPGALATSPTGEVFFTEPGAGRTHRLGADAGASLVHGSRAKAPGQAFGPEGRHFAVTADGKIMVHDRGKTRTLASGVRGTDLVAAHNGNVYVAEPGPVGAAASKVWLVRPDGKKQVVDTGLEQASGITLSPDQTLLYVADGRTHWIYSYQIQSDGTLKHKQQYYWIHSPDTSEDSGAADMAVDREGRLYVATRMGVQVCDQPGRVHCILPVPGGQVTSLTLGGAELDTLYVTTGDAVYRRKLGAKGAYGWAAPHRPPVPGL